MELASQRKEVGEEIKIRNMKFMGGFDYLL